MDRLLAECTGTEIGGLHVPPFQLRSGEVVSWKMPGPTGSRTEELVIALLTGKQAVLGLSRFGRVMYADHLFMSSRNRWQRFSFLFHRPLIVDRVRRLAGITRSEAEEIVRRHGVDLASRVAGISGNERLLLAFDVIWARGAEVALFTTAGLDSEVIYRELAKRLEHTAAIELCYEGWSRGRKYRRNFPGAMSLDLTWTRSVPAAAH
jgi:hypothetical protein